MLAAANPCTLLFILLFSFEVLPVFEILLGDVLLWGWNKHFSSGAKPPNFI